MVKTCDDSNKKWKMIAWVYFALVFVIIHIIATPSWGDDQVNRNAIADYGYNVFRWVYERFFTWSSRFIIDLFVLSIPSLPYWVWRVMDFVVIGILFFVATRYTDKYIETALLLCAYPFMHMGSAGWIATTVTYVWPFTAAVTAIYWLYANKIEGSLLYSIAYIFLVIFAMNNEMAAFLFLVVMPLYIYYDYDKLVRNKRCLYFAFFYVLIAALGLLNAFICPGNTVRRDATVGDISQWDVLTLVDKLRICIVATWQHFTSIPNVVFILFGVLLACVVWVKTSGIRARIIGIAPSVLSIISTIIYFFINVVRDRNLNYLYPESLPLYGSAEYYEQLIDVIMAALYLVSTIFSIVIIYRGERELPARAGGGISQAY